MNIQKKSNPLTGIKELNKTILNFLLTGEKNPAHQLAILRVVCKDWSVMVDPDNKLTERLIETFVANRFSEINFLLIPYTYNDNQMAAFKQMIIKLAKGELGKLNITQILHLKDFLQNTNIYRVFDIIPMLQQLHDITKKQSFENRQILCRAIDYEQRNTAVIQRKIQIHKDNSNLKKQLEILQAIGKLNEPSLTDNKCSVFLSILILILSTYIFIKKAL